MTLSVPELNRATLVRQLLLGRERLGPVEAVRQIFAVQAQHAASPYLALWNRIDGFNPTHLDDAFAQAAIVKATLMRLTLHAVVVDDHPATHEAMQPTLRGAPLGDRRFTDTGLSVEEADALVPALLDHAGRPRTAAQMAEHIAARTGMEGKYVWWAIRCYGPFRHAPTGGPWSFGHRPEFLATGAARRYDRDASDVALAHLVRRYLGAFGPASVADVGQFAMVQRSRVRTALGALEGQVEELRGPGGQVLYDLPGAPRPDGEQPAPPRLLGMWDSSLLAYSDRSRIIPEQWRKVVIRSNGDVLPTVLVDGYVAGVWRALADGIEVTAFEPLPKRAWQELAVEADSLRALLAPRQVEVYSRYHHWWAKLPAGERRLLPG